MSETQAPESLSASPAQTKQPSKRERDRQKLHSILRSTKTQTFGILAAETLDWNLIRDPLRRFGSVFKIGEDVRAQFFTAKGDVQKWAESMWFDLVEHSFATDPYMLFVVLMRFATLRWYQNLVCSANTNRK